MNKIILMGRLTKDPEIRYSQNGSGTAVARYSLAVNRKIKREGEQETDFFQVVAFGKLAEFAEKYLHKGIKILITGRLQTGSYTNQDGQKIRMLDVIAEEIEFAESKSGHSELPGANEGFMNIPDGIEEELPFT